MKYLIYIFLFPVLAAHSQQYYNDAQLRTHLSVEKKINKQFSVKVKQQNRFYQNFSTFRRAQASAGVIWKLNKNIGLRADYMFLRKRQKDGRYYNMNWYCVSAVFKAEKNRWKFIYRNRFQVRSGPLSSPREGTYRLYDRNMFTVKYETSKRLTLYLAEELYIPLNSPKVKGIDRSRTFYGIEIKTTKNQQLEIYFMYQAFFQKNTWFEQKNTYDNSLPRRDYVYGIGYHFTIK